MKISINTDYKIGLRAIKTAIAVFVCAVISMFLNHQDVFCACIASVICMEQTYEETVITGINRFIGTLIGGFIGYLSLSTVNVVPYSDMARVIFLPICILAVVYICNLINKKSSVSIGCVVVIVILARFGSTSSDTATYVFQRVMDTILGVFVATFINKFSFWSKKAGSGDTQT